MTYLTAAQVEAFVLAVDEAGAGIDAENVTQTSDTLADFTTAWGRPDEVETTDDVVLHIWFRVQRCQGAPRRDLYVADFGTARAAAH